MREQRDRGGRLGEILFAHGWVSAVDLRDALAEQHGLDFQVESRSETTATASPEQRRSSNSLGRLLLDRGLITEAQLDAALAGQARTGQRLGRVLIANGAISTFTLAAALAEEQGLLARDPDVDATDLAFAVLHEWEPRELHVVCLAEGHDEELCWRNPQID